MSVNALEQQRRASIDGANIEYVGGAPVRPALAPDLLDSIHRNILRQGPAVAKQLARLSDNRIGWLRRNLKWIRLCGTEFVEVRDVASFSPWAVQLSVPTYGGPVWLHLDEAFDKTDAYTGILDNYRRVAVVANPAPRYSLSNRVTQLPQPQPTTHQ